MPSRRDFISASLGSLGTLAGLASCSTAPRPDDYEQCVERTWRHGGGVSGNPTALQHELVRYASLAPSSHNTQCWKFHLEDHAISILPDFSRRCPDRPHERREARTAHNLILFMYERERETVEKEEGEKKIFMKCQKTEHWRNERRRQRDSEREKKISLNLNHTGRWWQHLLIRTNFFLSLSLSLACVREESNTRVDVIDCEAKKTIPVIVCTFNIQVQ